MARLGAVGFLLFLVACSARPFAQEAENAQLVSSLQRQFSSSVEAEKAAVIATTDAASQTFAAQAQHASEEVDRIRVELRKGLSPVGDHAVLEKLDAFDSAWIRVKAVDAQILPLAVANTNLKAARLSQNEGAQQLDRFVDTLDAWVGPSSDRVLIRQIDRASVAALRIQTLLAPHIAAADDATMTGLERRIGDLETKVSDALKELRGQTSHPSAESFQAAEHAWEEYRKTTAEVIRLSRLNTNVLSFELSVHEKRDATESCQAALTALVVEFQRVQAHPSR
jgi:hypothetical protein